MSTNVTLNEAKSASTPELALWWCLGLVLGVFLPGGMIAAGIALRYTRFRHNRATRTWYLVVGVILAVLWFGTFAGHTSATVSRHTVG